MLIEETVIAAHVMIWREEGDKTHTLSPEHEKGRYAA